MPRSVAKALVAGIVPVVAVATTAVSGSGAAGAESARVAACPRGAVAAVIEGKRTCLRRGQRCKRSFDRQYHRYGFHCHGGRLTGGPPAPQPPAATVVATIRVPSTGGIAVGAGSVWVANTLVQTVTRISPQTNLVTATIPTGATPLDLFHGPTRIVVAHGSVWVADGRADCACVHRIDPGSNLVTRTIPLAVPAIPELRVAPLGMVATADAVWVALRHGGEASPTGSVVRVDPVSNAVTAVVPLGTDPEFGGPTGIAANAHGVWAGVPSMRSLVHVDPATNSVAHTIPGLTCGEGQLAADDAGVWVADCDVVRHIDPATSSVVRTIRIPGATGGGARGIAVGAGSVWAQAGPLFRIDPATGRIVGKTPLDLSLVWGEYSVEVGFGSVWVRQLDRVVRLRP
jgi:hypothetical protein